MYEWANKTAIKLEARGEIVTYKGSGLHKLSDWPTYFCTVQQLFTQNLSTTLHLLRVIHIGSIILLREFQLARLVGINLTF